MAIADAIPGVLAARAARAAAKDAERSARDAFIQPAFAQLAARFEELLADALGTHAQIVVTAMPVVDAVQGRTFATLNKRIVMVRSTIGLAPQTLIFTPQLDFREADQFGLIACAIDFEFTPGRTRGDTVARALVERGIQMSGRTVGRLLLPLDEGTAELTARDLEDAFTAWWLR
jgi:hypothetical protein